MCFSAPASFLAAAVTGAAGAAAMMRVHRREELPLAAMPLFFAVQQAIEGFLWLSLQASPGGPPSSLLIQLFLHFALVFWPVFAPLTVLLIEPDPRRRRWIGVCLVSGIVVAVYFLWSLNTSPQTASIEGGHIVYSGDPGLPLAVRVLYPVATCIGPVLSSLRAVRLLGAILIAASLVAYLAYWQAFTSVWCYFAAAASGVILFQFEQARQKRRSAAARAA
jgi:hypothetical protein